MQVSASFNLFIIVMYFLLFLLIFYYKYLFLYLYDKYLFIYLLFFVRFISLFIIFINLFCICTYLCLWLKGALLFPLKVLLSGLSPHPPTPSALSLCQHNLYFLFTPTGPRGMKPGPAPGFFPMRSFFSCHNCFANKGSQLVFHWPTDKLIN